MDYSQKLTKDLFTELRSEWPRVRMAWTGFVSDLDYGTEIARAIPRITADWSQLGEEKRSIRVDADHGWQSSGIVVQPGMTIQVTASGQYSLANDPKPWVAEPQGITLRYFRGQPLGKLLMTIAPLAEQETRQTTPWEATPVGRSLQLKVDRPGLLMFKINDYLRSFRTIKVAARWRLLETSVSRRRISSYSTAGLQKQTPHPHLA